LHTFSEEEDLLRESGELPMGFLGLPAHTISLVKRFAQDVVGPKVREMDENEMMDPSVINGLFEQGVCNPRLLRCI
jgi:short-chain 2-methylacyl-CoA dehydrogenase